MQGESSTGSQAHGGHAGHHRPCILADRCTVKPDRQWQLEWTCARVDARRTSTCWDASLPPQASNSVGRGTDGWQQLSHIDAPERLETAAFRDPARFGATSAYNPDRVEVLARRSMPLQPGG